MTVVTETLEVEGIRCERCVQALATALRGVDGLAGASANLMGEVTVSYDVARGARGGRRGDRGCRVLGWLSPRRAVVVSACRTPFGRYGGALSAVRPDDLAALVVAEAVRRAGCARRRHRGRRLRGGQPVGRGQPQRRTHGGAARGAACRGRRPDRQSPVRLRAAGDRVGGARDPGGRRRPLRRRRRRVDDPRAARHAEARVGLPARRSHALRHDARLALRQSADARALRRRLDGRDRRERRRALRGLTRGSGRLGAAIAGSGMRRPRPSIASSASSCPSRCPARKGPSTLVERDEHPRPDTTAEKLAALRPAFREGGSVTAGNAAGINDGAAALVVAEEGYAARPWPAGARGDRRERGRRRRACRDGRRARSPPCARCSTRAGLARGDLDRIELNEAFASQVLASIRELGLDDERVNVNGGAIARRPPARRQRRAPGGLAVHELERCELRYGLATMCVGVGREWQPSSSGYPSD